MQRREKDAPGDFAVRRRFVYVCALLCSCESRTRNVRNTLSVPLQLRSCYDVWEDVLIFFFLRSCASVHCARRIARVAPTALQWAVRFRCGRDSSPETPVPLSAFFFLCFTRSRLSAGPDAGRLVETPFPTEKGAAKRFSAGRPPRRLSYRRRQTKQKKHVNSTTAPSRRFVPTMTVNSVVTFTSGPAPP